MKSKLSLYFFLALVLVVRSTAAQTTGYRVSGLTANRPGANHQSATLLNPWGIAFLPTGQGFFIAENASGRVDSYDPAGNFLVGITIPAPAGSAVSFSKPTGIVADPEGNFGPRGAHIQFVVAADNGTLWSFTEANGTPQTATLFFDSSASGAMYTGVAILHPDCCSAYVAAANFSQGKIDTFAGQGAPLVISANAYVDPNLPPGYSPFNIQKIGNSVFVVYALPDAAHNPVMMPGSALINVFDLDGNFVKRFISPGAAGNVLDVPWGITQASADFGRFGTAILVGDLGDGAINAFDPGGNFLGQLTDTTGNELIFLGLHGLAFRADGVGDPNALYEVAGAPLGQPPLGTFGAITSATETTTTLDAPASAALGVPVTLTANVSSLAGAPTGSITFFEGANVMGRQELVSTATATFTLGSLGVGSHHFTAQYIGTFDSSTSNAVSVTITAGTGTQYHFTPILSDLPGLPNGPDRLLKNPWGLTFIPGGAFWTAENASSNVSAFNETGASEFPFDTRVELANGAPAKPTGIVFNPTAAVHLGDFTAPNGTPGQIVLATEDGIIAVWGTINGERLQVAPIARDDSAAGAVYKGLAIIDPQTSRPYLALADFHQGIVQIYDSLFSPTIPGGVFADPTLPAGYAPFNIQVIGNEVFLTYAVQDAVKHDPVVGPGNGIVNIFDTHGNFVRRLASNGVLNAPWGLVQASANFGEFSNDILIGNFGDGTINAFDPATGNLVGTLKDEAGDVIAAPGLWGLTFRSDNGTIDPNTLFFVQGQNRGVDGLFGSIIVTPLTANVSPSLAISFSGDPSTTGLPPNSETFGSIFNLIADVTASSGTPTGAVAFFDGLAPLGTALLVNGRATVVDTVPLAAGPHLITARYSGDATFLLTKNTATLHIIGIADTVTLKAPATATQGSAVILTAKVSAVQAVPTGTVSFQDGAATLGTAGLDVSGMATLTVNTLAAGIHTIVAVYSGDFAFQSGSSQPATLTVQTAPNTATHFALSAPTTATSGNAFNFTVTALDAGGHTATSYGGTVHFTSSDGGATLPINATLTAGTATFSATLHTSGSQTITAADTVTPIITGTSSAITISSNPATTLLSLSAPASAAPGSPVSLTATIHSTGGTPTGTIVFQDGSTNLGTASLNAGGIATLTISTLTAGTHSLTASYAGDGTFGASTSTAVSVSIANKDFAFAAAPTSTTVTAGGSTQFMLTITPAGGFADQVTFSCTPVTGITCAFNPAAVTPTNGAASTTLTVSTSASVPRYGVLLVSWIGPGSLLLAFVLFGLVAFRGANLRNIRPALVSAMVVLAIAGLSLTVGGCGGYGGGNTQPNRGTASVMVTAQSGTLTHTTTLSVIVQ